MHIDYKLLISKEKNMTRKDLLFVVKRAAMEIVAIGGIIMLVLLPVLWLVTIGMRSSSPSSW